MPFLPKFSAGARRVEILALGAIVHGLAIALTSGGASAQSFDCAKANGPIETAICGSPDLAAQDTALATAYGRARSALDPTQLAMTVAAQREWLAQRARVCSPFAASPARLASCLADSAYRTRIVALDVGGSASRARSCRRLRRRKPPRASRATPVSAAADQDTILHVDAPGRLSIRAESATGVALQLVDMIAGPGDIEGEAGVRDGRLDVLVDQGAYKIRSFGAPKAPLERRA